MFDWLPDLDEVDDHVPPVVQEGINRGFGPSREPVSPGTATQDPLAPGPMGLPLGPDGRPIPVTQETLPDFIRQRWASSMNAGVSPEVAAAAAANGSEAGTFRGGSTTAGVMTDFYGVPVTLPEGMTPEMLLEQMRDNPNAIGRGGEPIEFSDITGFPEAGPGGRQVGDHADLDIAGGDDGLVIYNDTDVSDGEISVNTGVNQESGIHPVSGQRSWGFVPYGDGQYMFYTAGSDSHNMPGTDLVGAGAQSQTWMAMSRALQREVRARGGSADDIVFDRERQDTALMQRAPGTITAADIQQDGALESDQRGQRHLAEARRRVLMTETGVDDFLLGGAEVAADGVGVASRYGAMGVDYVAEHYGNDVGTAASTAGGWLADQTGIAELRGAGAWIDSAIPRDIGNPDDYQFGGGRVVEAGVDMYNSANATLNAVQADPLAAAQRAWSWMND